MQRTIRVAVAATALAALAAAPAVPVAAAGSPGSVTPAGVPGAFEPAEPEPDLDLAEALPGHIAVLGDSISAGTGSTGGGGEGGLPGQTRRANSWATGDRDGLDSVFQRLDAARPEPTVATNLAQNGARADDLLDQLAASPVDVETFQVQIGGNDLCRPTVEEMTPTADYRGHLDDALAWIAAERPGASVQLNSVPDIFRLWEIRRSNFIAVLFWASGVIPCQSLLASPTSTSPANMARREAVRARGLEYNDQLREACAAYDNCRYDDDAAWEFSNDPDRFVDADISTQDHFHPSYSGQRKLAEVAWGAGFGSGFTAAEAWWLPTPQVEDLPEEVAPDEGVVDEGVVDDDVVDGGAVEDEVDPAGDDDEAGADEVDPAGDDDEAGADEGDALDDGAGDGGGATLDVSLAAAVG